MILELAARLCTGLFAGAALSVSLVEHPARLAVHSVAGAAALPLLGLQRAGIL